MSNKYTKFGILDVVVPKEPGAAEGGVVMDYDFRPVGDRLEVVYEVFADGTRHWVREADVERIGRVPTPLRYEQPVTVAGKVLGRTQQLRGRVIGIVWTPETNEWGYSVRLTDGTSIDVEAEDVRPIRIRTARVPRVHVETG